MLFGGDPARQKICTACGAYISCESLYPGTTAHPPWIVELAPGVRHECKIEDFGGVDVFPVRK